VARIEDRLPHNAEGDFYVASTCIDCDACRLVAPTTFERAHRIGKSFVANQPQSTGEKTRALMALITCPTGSIGTRTKHDLHLAADHYPDLLFEGVFYCGFADQSTFGCASYLIQRPDGNVLVDSPRAAKPLVRKLHELGGVRTMFLTHKDDVGQHEFFHKEFGCERIIHDDDVVLETADCEVKIEGIEPTILDEDLVAIPLPGHTKGSMALLFRDEVLFSGDSLWGSPKKEGGLDASRSLCQYSWTEQMRSLRRLLDVNFEYLLPGHGRRYFAQSPEIMRTALTDALMILA